MKATTILLFILLIAISFSCRKTDPDLEPSKGGNGPYYKNPTANFNLYFLKVRNRPNSGDFELAHLVAEFSDDNTRNFPVDTVRCNQYNLKPRDVYQGNYLYQYEGDNEFLYQDLIKSNPLNWTARHSAYMKDLFFTTSNEMPYVSEITGDSIFSYKEFTLMADTVLFGETIYYLIEGLRFESNELINNHTFSAKEIAVLGDSARYVRAIITSSLPIQKVTNGVLVDLNISYQSEKWLWFE